MKNKICVISGATDGIGKVAARELAKRGAAVRLIGRNAEKGNRVQDEIIQTSGNADIRFYQADLSLMAETQRVAGEIAGDHDHIDVLLNNAGGYFTEFLQTAEGLEYTFALNHMNYFLLTRGLLPLLQKSPAGRIVNVSSGAHNGSALDWDNMQGEKSYSGWNFYCRSKLMNLLFTFELADRISDSKISVNALHPGFVKTRFGDNNRGFWGLGIRVSKYFGAISVEKGAQTSVYLSSSPDLDGVSGKYFFDSKEKRSSQNSYNLNDRKRLWAYSEKILEEASLN